MEYTKLKTADHYWTDPSADELVQRHRIRGPPNRQDSPAKRPALGVGIPSLPLVLLQVMPRGLREGQLVTVLLEDTGWALEMPQGSGHPEEPFPHTGT